jgi:ferredoxin
MGKGEVAGFLDGLLAESGCTVVAPVIHDGIVTFRAISSGAEAALDYSNSVSSPKGVVLPQAETLLSCPCSSPEGEGVVEHIPEPGRVVLFGVRPCDARGIRFLDGVFGGEVNRDTFYASRRESLLVVSMGCPHPRATCFCTTTGGGPFSTEGSDLLMAEHGDEYIVFAVTERGARAVSRFGLAPAEERAVKAVVKNTDLCVAEMQPRVDLSALKGSLDASFDETAWNTLTEKCLGCGVCTYLCPTCHCFDIVDEVGGDSRVRNRIWDSCQFPCFTKQASGFNPRPTYKERYRQRFMHKFSFCADRYGTAGCVGCGRCVTECPVNLDIRTIMAFFHEKPGEE